MARTFYAVQHGDDYSSDYGSTKKREAYQMARSLHEEYPEEEIRISVCTTEDDFCKEEIVVFEANAE